jgi:hypothetical protein
VHVFGDDAGFDQHFAEPRDGLGGLRLSRRAALEVDAVPQAARLLEHERSRQAVVERVNEQIDERRRLEKPHRLCGFVVHSACSLRPPAVTTS